MKKLFAPEETLELLRGWQIHANKGREKHESAARRLENRYRQIGVASIILSAIVGASLFASLEVEFGSWIRIVAGITSIFASVLSSLITFHRYEEKTEKHRFAGVRYKSILRELEQILATPNPSTITQDLVNQIRQALDELETITPVVPDDINRTVENRYQIYQFVPKAEDLAISASDRAKYGRLSTLKY